MEKQQETQLNRVSVVYHKDHNLHYPPAEHSEQPLRMNSIYKHLKESKLLEECDVIEDYEPMDEEVLHHIHNQKYINKIKELSAKNNCSTNSDSFYSEGTHRASLLGVTGCCMAIDKIFKKETDHVFAAVRPPGHHANTSDNTITGFCVYNNVAIAIKYARQKYGIKKAAVFDWDVHHGDSTQQFFYNDPDTLFCSIHKYQEGYFYPGTSGYIGNYGEEKGKGYNMNVPWDLTDESGVCRTVGDNEYIFLFERLIYPIFKEFNPEIIMISAGFDSANGDQLGGISLSPHCYAYIIRRFMELGKPILANAEGGYNCDIIPICTDYCIRALRNEQFPLKQDNEKWNIEYMQATCKPNRVCFKLNSDFISLYDKFWPLLKSNQELVAYENRIKQNVKEYFENDLIISPRDNLTSFKGKLIKMSNLGEKVFYRMLKQKEEKIKDFYEQLGPYLLNYIKKEKAKDGEKYLVFENFSQQPNFNIQDYSYWVMEFNPLEYPNNQEYYQNKQFLVTKLVHRDKHDKVIEKWDIENCYGLNYDMLINDWSFDKFILTLRFFLQSHSNKNPNIPAFEKFRECICKVLNFIKAPSFFTFESFSIGFFLDNNKNDWIIKILSLNGFAMHEEKKKFSSKLEDVVTVMKEVLHNDQIFIYHDHDEGFDNYGF